MRSNLNKVVFNIVLLTCVQVFGQGLTSSASTEISKIFEDYTGKPGCAIGIFQDGKITFAKGYGIASLDSYEEIDKYTLFDIASVSKQITAGCIYLLQEQGKLSVNDKIQKYIPSLPEYEEGPILIKHLINHSSGLRSYLKLLYARGIPWSSPFSNESGIELLSKQRGINFEPGTRFSYSNSGYMILAKIIEQASGMTFAEYANKNFFIPLGMTQTIVGHPENLDGGIAIGYDFNGSTFSKEHFTANQTVGDGGVYTSIVDFFKWSENLRTAEVGGLSWKNNMLTSLVLKNGRPSNYGGGLFLGNYQNLPGMYTIGHSGEWAGYRSLFFKFVNQDVAFVILSNNANTNVWAILNQLVPILLQEELQTARKSLLDNQQQERYSTDIKKEDTVHLSKYTGHYFNPIEGYTRTITLENDTLKYVRTNGAGTPLTYVRGNSFQFLGMSNVRLHFDPSSKPMQLTLHVNDDAPITFEHFVPYYYQSSEMNQFEGIYHSKELDVDYEIKRMDHQLSVILKGNELVRLNPVMKDVFNDVHFGYLKFERDRQDRIKSFTINDETVNNINFKKTSL